MATTPLEAPTAVPPEGTIHVPQLPRGSPFGEVRAVAVAPRAGTPTPADAARAPAVAPGERAPTEGVLSSRPQGDASQPAEAHDQGGLLGLPPVPTRAGSAVAQLGDPDGVGQPADGSLPPPAVRKVEEGVVIADAPTPTKPILYGSPDGDIHANSPAQAPRLVATGGAASPRSPAPSVEARPAADAVLTALRGALTKARAGDRAGLTLARSALMRLATTVGTHPAAPDVERGIEALNEVGELRALGAESPIRSFMLRRCRERYRGSRWAILFE